MTRSGATRSVHSRGRKPSLLQVLLLLSSLSVSSAFSQTLPPLEEVVRVESARYTPAPLGGIQSEVISSGLATEAELQADLLADRDGDGVVNFRDSCPFNPNCQTHADIAAGESDPATPVISQVDSMEDVVQWALEENATKALYSQEVIIDTAEQAGFDAMVVQGWRDEFLEPDPPEPETCRKCRKRIWKECKQECRGERGQKKFRCRYRCVRENKAQCLGSCSEEIQKTKAKIQKVKRKIKKALKKGKKRRPPGVLRRLFNRLYHLFHKLIKLVRWW